MITRRVKIQLAVFGTLTLIAVSLIFFHYARIPAEMGIGQVNAQATFSEGAGIYPNANVTYRGVTVGKVTAVGLAKDGVDVSFRINQSADVPKDVDATIKSVSAIGEQYVDLTPRGDATALLSDGDAIPLANTSIPRPIAGVLDDVDGLLGAVPRKDLSTVLDEADKAFQGLGPSIARLNKNAQLLVSAADENYEQTHRLILDGEQMLDGQLASSDAIRSWSSDLAEFTTQLRKSDKDLRPLLADVPPAANEVDGLLSDLSGTVPALVDSSQVTADLLKAYHKPLEQVLVAFPRVAMTNLGHVGPGSGRDAGLAFKTVANYPGGCATGWPKAGQPHSFRGSNQIADAPPAPGAYCKIPQSDARVARGARNLECFEPGSPAGRRAATIYQCRGGGYGATGAGDAGPNLVTNPLAAPINGLLGLLGGSGAAPTQEALTLAGLLMPEETS